MIYDYLKFSLKGIQRRSLRAWLTIIGIVIGVAAIVSLITIGQGMQAGIQEQFEKLGIRNIRIVPGSLQGPPGPGFSLPNNMIDRVESIQSVEYVDAVVTDFAVVEFDKEKDLVTIIGYDTSLGNKGFVDTDVDVEVGRFFKQTDSKSVLIGNDVAHDLFDKDIRLKNSLLIKDTKFRVIGIFENTGTNLDNNIYVPLDEARDLLNQHDTVNAMVVKLLPGFDIDEAAEEITRKLERDFDDETFDVLTPQQIVNQINQILGVVSIVLGGIATISLIVGAIGIMNSMFTSVLERTRQIGLMKAIGARNTDIFLIFLLESGITGLAGGLIGAVIGSAIALAAGAAAQAAGISLLSMRIDLVVITVALVLSFLLGIISGTFPAWQASKLKPVDALRYE